MKRSATLLSLATRIHRDNAVFAFADLGFTFTNGVREPIPVNRHLAAASRRGRC